MANAAVVIFEIASHPALWQPYNKTLGLHPAKPVDDEVYENTVFCNWVRLLVSGINDVSCVQSPENSVPFKYENENMRKKECWQFLQR